MFNWIEKIMAGLVSFQEKGEPLTRYHRMRRNIIFIMIFVSVVPLALMALINNYQYQKALQAEIIRPVKMILNKSKHSFELFFAERISAVSFIASAYSFEDLADQATLNRIFQVVQQEFDGFVDIGLISNEGIQVTYSGPYELKGKNYKEQEWFNEVKVQGTYISNVFLGYRKFPHFVMAVRKGCLSDGGCWILRATIDTEAFDGLVAAMGLDPMSDAFVLNREGIFQTTSKFYGEVLEKLPLAIPPNSLEPTVLETKDAKGQDIFLGYTNFKKSSDFILMVIKPRLEIMKSWYSLKSDFFWLFVASVMLIFLVVFRLSGVIVRRIRESEEKRQAIDHEMQYTNKLASIGRLAAGVAHEINNPLAIINEKAGLMEDLMRPSQDNTQKERYMPLILSIIKSVDRCRAVTHRLLGFARRMDVAIDWLDLNEVITEVLGFLERDALYRNIKLDLHLEESLPQIASDQGQLQQVFLNILSNAFEAVSGEGGEIKIISREQDLDSVSVSIQDNGCGMSEEIVEHIFEPFYTTKKGHGTGLGLSITYGIIKKLGGEIEVDSKEGEGTVFTVTLPIKNQQDMGDLL